MSKNYKALHRNVYSRRFGRCGLFWGAYLSEYEETFSERELRDTYIGTLRMCLAHSELLKALYG